MQPFRAPGLSILPLLGWYDYSFASERGTALRLDGLPRLPLAEGYAEKDVTEHFTAPQWTSRPLCPAEKVINIFAFPAAHRPDAGFVPTEKPPSSIDRRFHPPRAPFRGGSIPRFTFYGHSHINRQVTVGGVGGTSNNAFGYPSESWMTSKISCASMNARFVDYVSYHTGSAPFSLSAHRKFISGSRLMTTFTTCSCMPRIGDLLSDGSRSRSSASISARDRRRYLVTRALVRTVLSRYVAIDPRSGSFPNAYGRPAIVNAESPRSLVVVKSLAHEQPDCDGSYESRELASMWKHPRPPGLRSTSPIAISPPQEVAALATGQSRSSRIASSSTDVQRGLHQGPRNGPLAAAR